MPASRFVSVGEHPSWFRGQIGTSDGRFSLGTRIDQRVARTVVRVHGEVRAVRGSPKTGPNNPRRTRETSGVKGEVTVRRDGR